MSQAAVEGMGEVLGTEIPVLTELQKTATAQATTLFVGATQELQNSTPSWLGQIGLYNQQMAALEVMGQVQLMPTTVGDVALQGAGMVGGTATHGPNIIRQTIKTAKAVGHVVKGEQKVVKTAKVLRQAPLTPPPATSTTATRAAVPQAQRVQSQSQSLTLLTREMEALDAQTRRLTGVQPNRGVDGKLKQPGQENAGRSPSMPTTATTPAPQNISRNKRTLEALDLDYSLKIHKPLLPGEGKVHKNSLEYVGETHVYAIRKASDGKVHKIGESAQGVRKIDGASKRAELQARKLRKETGEDYKTEIRQTFLSKKEARQYETKMIETSKKILGKDALPGNKTTH